MFKNRETGEVTYPSYFQVRGRKVAEIEIEGDSVVHDPANHWQCWRVITKGTKRLQCPQRRRAGRVKGDPRLHTCYSCRGVESQAKALAKVNSALAGKDDH